jgi:hypothetical protein
MRPGSCAMAVNGHVTLAPKSAINSRRLIVSPVPRPDRLPYVSTFPQGGNLGVHVASGSFTTGWNHQQVQPCPLFADRYRNAESLKPTRRAKRVTLQRRNTAEPFRGQPTMKDITDLPIGA